MNQIVTPQKNSNSIMQMTRQKRKVSLVMRAAFMMICALCFAIPAKAQQALKMTNGTRQVPNNGFLFYDSGGPLLFDPATDPENANEYNWTTWYQHNEGYTLTLTVPDGQGVRVEFSKLLINNDFLYFYEGDVVDDANLISILTCNDYSSSLDNITVISHGNMTIRFESDQRWRDEGWVATITQTDAFVPQPPVALMAACANQMVLIPTCNADAGGTMPMQYKLGSGDWTDYTTTGVWVDLSSQTFPLTVTTRTKIDEGSFSSENTFTFNKILPPGVPGKEENHDVNKVTVYFPNKPEGVNDTYYIRWTINNNPTTANENPLLWEQAGHEFQQPSNTPNTVPAGDIDYTNVDLALPFYIHIATRGTTCPDLFSGVVTVAVTERHATMPTISFSNTGSTTLECSLEDATIYYTINGSIPTTSSTPYNGSFDVQPGTTVKAIAVKNGYEPSAVASAIFIPGGGSNVYGDVVLLDDREDHSWSYYSDGDQPIHSLNPADVKITYFGNGTGTVSTTDGATPANNSWTSDATGVQVGPNEAGNQFIYLKTLENDDPEGADNNYSYTTIPNPFSKRPTYSNMVATRNIYVRGTIQQDAYGYINVTYTDVNNTQRTWNGYIYWTSQQGSIYPEATLQVLAGTTVSFSLYTSNGGFNYNSNSHVGCEVRYDDADGEVIWNGIAYWQNNNQNNPVTGSATVQEGGSSAGSVTFNDYRGFYAWRVKRISSGLEIKRANGNTVNVGDMVDAEEAIRFVTSKEDGNEVDFEALWAKAYVVTYDSDNAVTVTNTTVGFERNFVVLARNYNDFTLGGDNNRLNNPYNRAVTISSYYPDGTVGANRCGIDFGGDLDLNYDLKLEYVQNNDYANSGYYINANGHYLCIGRGMTTGSTIAAQINAIRGDVDGSNTRIRLESGNYGHIEVIAGEYGTEGQPGRRFHTLMTFGTDYDRASKDNNKLTVAPTNGEITFGNQYPLYGQNGNRRINASINRRERTFTCVTKSGKFQQDQFENTIGSNSQSFYIGTTGESNSYSGKRYLTVEGGEFACIAGGRGPKADGDNNTYPTTTATYVDRNDTTATIRIRKDAIIHGGVYGGAAASAAWGNRKIIITGGTIEGWVAGGCNGTQQQDYGGRGIGDAYIYVGGNAIIGGDSPTTIPNLNNIPGTVGGNVFGTGRGSYGGESVPSSMDNSYVVIADNCDILHSVYGGGNLGRVFEGEGHAANVYILGGTIHENVYGGANLANSQMAFIHIKDGVVEGSVYGGSNTEGTANGLAQINMSGGSVGGSVFGGGYGAATNMNAGTEVNISGGTINNNVYGGGEEGTVTSNTNVNFSGGSVQNVFGAGKGVEGGSTALISGQTHATVSGGTVNHCVYGGGEIGDVNNGLGNLASTVNINGGTVKEDVFGGGRMGKTTGNVIVNVYNGNIDGNVFGGAYGSRNTVFIAGTHTVNIMGGNIYTNVYGGSRQADDALTFNPTAGDQLVNCVNISGGHIYYQVFAGGFFGQNYGSVYAFIGQNAILNAPNHAPTDGVSYNIAALMIDGSVWAGADFGSFDGSEFGRHTIEGRSNVYIDGLDYNTVSTQPSSAGYMNIGSSVLGVGTSCYAGKHGSDLIFRNYGQAVSNPAYGSKESMVEPYTTATRNLKSIQFFNNAVIEKAHVHFIGQGRINSLLTTEEYALYGIIDVLRVTNGSSLFIDFPIDQMKKLGSYTCPDVYAASPVYTKVDFTDLPTAGKDNKFRVNAGSFINVKFIGAYNPSESETGYDYGEFEGFFYVMTEDENGVCAYARPKQSKDDGNQIDPDYDNALDGGFLSYNDDYNTYTAGTLTDNAFFASPSDAPGDGTPGVQMPYENHTLNTGSKNGEQYFRIWRYGGMYSYRQGVFNAVAKTTSGYSTTDVLINLPAARGDGSYYRIKTVNGFPSVDYGSDVLTVNAGVNNSTNGVPAADGWMYYQLKDNNVPDDHGHYEYGNDIEEAHVASGLALLNNNVNATFGLVAIPQGSLVYSDNADWLICNDASDENEVLTTTKWWNKDITINPSVLFRLTYNNNLTNNVVWDPITIIFEQCDANGNVKDEVEVALSVSTTTTIEQDFTAQTFAFMDGTGDQADTYVAKVVLPSYFSLVNTPGEVCNWTFKSAQWQPETGFANAWKQGSGYIHDGEDPKIDEFSMQIQPSYNFDNTLGWTEFDHTAHDLNGLAAGTYLSATDGRNTSAFDFILHFDGRARCEGETLMGTLHVVLQIDNYKDPENGNKKDLVIDVEVWRRGEGTIYYLDGVNGNNFFSGTYPNAPKKTLSGIFNHSKYKAGDKIFVVNTVTANSSTTLDWNGDQYGKVILYRYPGGHELYPSVKPNEVYVNYSEDNPDNVGFEGTLVRVESSMSMHGIVLDGTQRIVDTTNFDAHPNGNIYYPKQGTFVKPTSPLVEIAENATLTIYSNSRLQWNYSNCDGGAIYNAGKLVINEGSTIADNAVLSTSYNGAGVYLKGGATLVASDLVTINGNHIVTHEGLATNSDKNNNVYLASDNSVIQVGTSDPNDVLGILDDQTRIGVTKGDWGDYYYTPIAYSDGGSDYLENLIPTPAPGQDEAPAADYLIFDDDLYYRLVTINTTPGYEPSSEYLFWVGTWVTTVRTKPDDFDPENIDTPEELAWAISLVNGLNGVSPATPNANFNITADLDMKARIWVPMGTNTYPYTGNFNGNGHVIEGVRSPLNSENMGMFGVIGNGAKVQNMVLGVNFAGGNSVNMAAVGAVMNGGAVSNVEAAGTVTGTSTTEVMGGLVAQKNGGEVHSSFAVTTLTTTNADSDMGGLVGINSGNLYNSYSNVIMSGSDRIGGLAGKNLGVIENCYAVIGEQTFPAFAYDNTGHNINHCYAADGVTNYVTSDKEGTLNQHGNYAAVEEDIKDMNYMYYDNLVSLVGGGSNNYVPAVNEDDTYLEHTYRDGHIVVWRGLLSVLNQWVRSHSGYTLWNRPINSAINGDLPVLAFPEDQSMATLNSDGRYLQYSTGLDNLLEDYTDASGIFVYGAVTDVENVPANDNVKVTVAEDAVLKQAANAGAFNATVGVTFDNSYKSASDYFGNGTGYDWHFLSSSLTEAPMGITYGKEGVTFGYGNPADISVMEGNYFPNDLMSQSEVAWDLYSFYEPQYHWINLKRSSTNHWHFDYPHGNIEYTNETIFTPGKGYMAAISQDSYLNNTGTLNKADFTIGVTSDSYDPGITEIGYNLLGNPYQAYLDMSAFMNNTNNKALFENSYWVYIAEGDNYIAGNFAASDNVELPSGTLHPHQAFFVKVKQNNGSNTGKDGMEAQFTYDMATADAQAYSFFRDNKVNYPLVNLKANNERGMQDLAVIEFNRPEMGGSNKLRALNNASFELCSHMEGEDYSILFAPEGTERVPVRFRTKEDGTFTLTWETMHGEFSSLLLVDNMTGTVTDMLRADRYTFDAGADDYASRFYITYRVTDVEEHGEGDGTFAWFDGSEWIVEGQGVLDVVDVMGRTVYSERLVNEKNRVGLNGVAKGVYLLRVSDGTNTMVQKIVVR